MESVPGAAALVSAIRRGWGIGDGTGGGGGEGSRGGGYDDGGGGAELTWARTRLYVRGDGCMHV